MTMRMERFICLRGRMDEHGGLGTGLGFQQEPAPHRAKVKDFEDRDENNAERGRAIGRHEARRDDIERDEDQRDNRAGKAQVESGVEKVLLVLEQPQFDARRNLLAPDFGELDEASDVEERLQHEEEQQR